jgi:hypothetical protein
LLSRHYVKVYSRTAVRVLYRAINNEVLRGDLNRDNEMDLRDLSLHIIEEGSSINRTEETGKTV